jgi:hypothetical protein
MGFFEDIAQPEPPDEDDYVQPVWAGPPRGWIGGVVPVELSLAKSEAGAVFVHQLSAFPTGLTFEVTALARERGHDAFGFGALGVASGPQRRTGQPGSFATESNSQTGARRPARASDIRGWQVLTTN